MPMGSNQVSSFHGREENNERNCSARQLRAVWRAGAVRPLIGPRQGIGSHFLLEFTARMFGRCHSGATNGGQIRGLTHPARRTSSD